jgi:hypothetical protein
MTRFISVLPPMAVDVRAGHTEQGSRAVPTMTSGRSHDSPSNVMLERT